MQNFTARQKPAYPIEAVDNALTLLQLLRDGGRVRLKEAAAELGVAPSTAHRLLAMLVYRGFAVQDASRHYIPGPAMGEGPAGISWSRLLRDVSVPHMEMLAARLGETVNLMVRVGTKVRFLSTVESSSPLRVGDRQGVVLPARQASGGKAMLAELEVTVLEQLYRSSGTPEAMEGTETMEGTEAMEGSKAIGSAEAMAADEFSAFLRELEYVRVNGFAANFEGTEEGISAVGVALHNRHGQVVGALSVATPATRFRRVFDAGLVAALKASRRDLETDIANNPASRD
ncbi:MAG TPA: IclR family transcriptional regulator [Micrococcaceae bacterium]|jgi:DNA-binding IclR family transcriptional regulator|nr:IclR family transcriptional regulator [Micrococcaceae bacterium]